jgi:type I restriction-modification system DNA methylase subunit
MTNKETVYKKIENLVIRFAEQEEFYKKTSYNQTETRRDFIDPFFDALGWDIDNKKGLLQTEREVNHEKRVDVKGHSKSADYSFNIHGKTLFFVEAKKPAILLKENPEPAIQIRTYGWNAKLNISILTDFEEFSIYDCTKKICKTDKASKHRIKFIYYKDYLKEFDFIYDTFSKESVVNGRLEQFVVKNINDREKETVDKEFLKSLENWRTYLATNIAANNKNLDEEEINYSVQQTIDRIVFLKICEDRAIEPEGNLKKCLKKGNYYKNLFEYFNKADQKYNSGIFDFEKDKLTTTIKIDNKIIDNIISDFDEIGYDFSKIPIEILGYAYEQFLGKVIRLEESGHAIIETKPEVRKAGGVFYTPQNIVDYIVNNTVGKLIRDKSPDEITKIKIIDPACGSGSFLLGAYQFLLMYHQNYYLKNPASLQKAGRAKESPLNHDGFLTTAEKKRILLNNIYGVDIDLQAVEVTKLSLLIKAMEGETSTSIETSLQLFHQRVLPSLDKNILSGNSLISPDFEGLGLTPKEERKINVFDWKTEFKDIFKDDTGFDVVIGNPPYGADLFAEKYIREKYPYSSQMKEINSYLYFTEKALEILKNNGLLGFIIPDTFLLKIQYFPFRKFLFNYVKITEIVETGSVFEQAKATPNVLLFFENTKIKNHTFLRKQLDFNKTITNILYDLQNHNWLSKSQLSYFEWNKCYALQIGRFIETEKLNVINKLLNNIQVIPLKNIDNIQIDRGLEGGKASLLKKKQKSVIPILIPENIYKFHIENLPENYVEETKKPFDYDRILVIRIRSPKIKQRIIAALETKKRATLKTLQQIFFVENSQYDLKYILAILNSRLLNFYCEHFLVDDLNKDFLSNLPIRKIDFSKETDRKPYNNIVINVEKIINLHEELSKMNIPNQKDNILRKIAFLESEIDKNLYYLYNISYEEIEIIEKQ